MRCLRRWLKSPTAGYSPSLPAYCFPIRPSICTRKCGCNGCQFRHPYWGSRFSIDHAACTVAFHATYPKSGARPVLGRRASVSRF